MRTPAKEIVAGVVSALADAYHTPEDDVRDAYFAGHFDGEGCIQILDRNKSRSFPVIHVSVGCVYKPVVLEYRSYFGGSVNIVDLGNINRGRSARIQWHWHISGYSDVARFLKRLLPYSKEKKSQMELAYSYLLSRLEFYTSGINNVSEEQLSRKLGEMKRLKQFEFKT